jgi:hypothetical protein
MFKRGAGKDEAWQGLVTDKKQGLVTDKKRASYDGQNMYHRVMVTLADGSVKEIGVRGGVWKTLNIGDRLVKRADQKVPEKVE